MKENYKVYVWEDEDVYRRGILMFVVATSVKEARELLLKKNKYIPKEYINRKPKIVKNKKAFLSQEMWRKAIFNGLVALSDNVMIKKQ